MLMVAWDPFSQTALLKYKLLFFLLEIVQVISFINELESENKKITSGKLV